MTNLQPNTMCTCLPACLPACLASRLPRGLLCDRPHEGAIQPAWCGGHPERGHPRQEAPAAGGRGQDDVVGHGAQRRSGVGGGGGGSFFGGRHVRRRHGGWGGDEWRHARSDTLQLLVGVTWPGRLNPTTVFSRFSFFLDFPALFFLDFLLPAFYFLD